MDGDAVELGESAPEVGLDLVGDLVDAVDGQLAAKDAVAGDGRAVGGTEQGELVAVQNLGERPGDGNERRAPAVQLIGGQGPVCDLGAFVLDVGEDGVDLGGLGLDLGLQVGNHVVGRVQGEGVGDFQVKLQAHAVAGLVGGKVVDGEAAEIGRASCRERV